MGTQIRGVYIEFSSGSGFSICANPAKIIITEREFKNKLKLIPCYLF